MIQFGEFNAGADYVERFCAYAVIHNESGQIAVVRTRKGYFLPGGGIHSDETAEQALIREVVEETGYASVILGHIGTAADRHRYIGAGKDGSVVHAVAHHGDDMPSVLQRTHQRHLFRRVQVSRGRHAAQLQRHFSHD